MSAKPSSEFVALIKLADKYIKLLPDEKLETIEIDIDDDIMAYIKKTMEKHDVSIDAVITAAAMLGIEKMREDS